MIENLLLYLPYILPTDKTYIKDESILITSRNFNVLYGTVILEILRHMVFLQKSEQQIKESKLELVVSTITEYIELSKQDCYVWDNHDTLIMFSSERMKPSGLNTYLKHRQQGKMKPKNFLVKKTQPANFNDKCIIGMLFQSLLILFDKLLTQVRINKTNTQDTLNNARLFGIIDATNQTNQFIYGFFHGLSRRKGALVTANTKHNIANNVKLLVKKNKLTPNHITKVNISETISLIQTAYKDTYKKKYPFSEKNLQKCIIDAIK